MIFYNQVHCQIINQENTNIFTMSPNGVLDNVFDNYGNKYNLLDVLINPNKTSSSTTLSNCSANSYFNLYFETGCGMEIVGDANHDQRRLVVCKVFEDISNFINSPLTATGNKVNIWVRNINAIPNVINSVLGLATGFYTGPSSNISGGIIENEIWKTIHLGVDSYSNISAPLVPNSANASSTGFYYHGMVAFNFNNINNLPVVNWNNNLGTSCPANKYDLYSVALHEITHALGFASLINSSGNSKLGANFKYFSRFDKFLKNNSSNDFLLTTSNTYNSALYDYGFNPLLNSSILQPQTTPTSPCSTDNTICGSSIKYVGTNTVPVYTPNCFANESSLSHFEDQCFNNTTNNLLYGNNFYFVMSDTNGSGITKRYLKPEERNTLCDIGYSTKTTYGSASTYQGIPPANYYGNVVCGGISVAGINDGLNPDGSYAFIGNIINPWYK